MGDHNKVVTLKIIPDNNEKGEEDPVGCYYCKRTTNRMEPCKVIDCGVIDLCLVCSKNNTVKHNRGCNYYDFSENLNGSQN